MKKALILAVAITMFAQRSSSMPAPLGGTEPPPNICVNKDFNLEFAEGETVIHIDGRGEGRIIKGPPFREYATIPFKVDPDYMCDLIQLAYRNGYFEAESKYGPVVKGDPTTATVFVTVGCVINQVAYVKGESNPPPVVLELARRIKKLAAASEPAPGRSSNYPLSPSHSAVTAHAYRGTRRAGGRARYRERSADLN